MNYYNSIDTLPIVNWHKIQESIKDGKIDLRYLIKGDIDKLPKFVNEKVLSEIYISLIFQFSELDVKFQKLHLLYKATYLKYSVEKQLSIENTDKDLNICFNEFLKYLDSNFKDFEITEYYINDYGCAFIDTLELSELWKTNLKNAKFYVFDEFSALIKDLPFSISTTLFSFAERFISERKIKIDKLEILNSHITEFYKEIKEYEAVHKARYALFLSDNILKNKDTEKEINTTIPDEIIRLNEFLNINLTLQSSVSEYLAARKRAKEKSKEIEKQSNKLKKK